MNFILPFFRFSLVLDGKPPNVTEIVKLCNLEIQQMVDETTTTAAGGTPYSKYVCLLYTSPSPRDKRQSRMPSSA